MDSPCFCNINLVRWCFASKTSMPIPFHVTDHPYTTLASPPGAILPSIFTANQPSGGMFQVKLIVFEESILLGRSRPEGIPGLHELFLQQLADFVTMVIMIFIVKDEVVSPPPNSPCRDREHSRPVFSVLESHPSPRIS